MFLHVQVLILVDLKALSEQDSVVVGLTGLGPDIDEYASGRYLPGEHIMSQSPSFTLIHSPVQTPMNTYLEEYLHILGVTRYDSVDTILAAYEQQKGCDAQNLPKYLGALEKLSKELPRADELGFKLAFEKSMGHHTDCQSTDWRLSNVLTVQPMLQERTT